MLASKRYNITLDPEVYDEFCKHAGKKGIKASTWIGYNNLNRGKEIK